jgi:hypothetical protein
MLAWRRGRSEVPRAAFAESVASAAEVRIAFHAAWIES